MAKLILKEVIRLKREEKIQFIVDSIKAFEDVTASKDIFKEMSDEELDKIVAFMDYLWEK